MALYVKVIVSITLKIPFYQFRDAIAIQIHGNSCIYAVSQVLFPKDFARFFVTETTLFIVLGALSVI